jgi:Phage integrase family
VHVLNITFRDIKRWFDEFAAPDVPGGVRMLPRAYDLMAQLKLIFRFGKLALPKSSGCAEVVEIFEDPTMEFPGGQRRRKEYLVYVQADLVRAQAHRRGRSSIAIAQAFMTECGVRQKDMIGEWVPRAEPGVTDVFSGPRKWLMGARWEEIDANFVWKHRLSKSVKGQDAIMDGDAGQTEEFALLDFPMVRAELERIAPLDRANFPASGPIIIYEKTGRPWCTSEFRRQWRECANSAGLPRNVQNRDSRPGAATEAELAGAPSDTVRRLLGHARGETTEIYRRGSREIRSNIAKLRAEKRK